MLLLAIELSKGGEHASNFTHSERKYKHKHFHNHEKTGSTLWFLTEFRRFFLTVPRQLEVDSRSVQFMEIPCQEISSDFSIRLYGIARFRISH
jgi:hypothetical protein